MARNNFIFKGVAKDPCNSVLGTRETHRKEIGAREM
jgi:hypothetical protein